MELDQFIDIKSLALDSHKSGVNILASTTNIYWSKVLFS